MEKERKKERKKKENVGGWVGRRAVFTSSNSHLAECRWQQRTRSENPATDRLVPVAQKINKQAKKRGERKSDERRKKAVERSRWG